MVTAVETNPIDTTFADARAANRMALALFLTVGYPAGSATADLAAGLFTSGADLLELGMPFSDPLGDGPTVQRANQGALASGVTVAHCLEVAAQIRNKPEAAGRPVIPMGYINPIMKYGYARFAADAARAGVNGLIVPDVPVEETDELREACQDRGIHLIYLLAPTSTEERINAVVARASGFIYCVGVTGVTGARKDLAGDLLPFLARVRQRTDLPLLVGFGISRPEHIAALRGHADGVVVASALIDLMDSLPEAERDAGVDAYVKGLRRACSAS